MRSVDIIRPRYRDTVDTICELIRRSTPEAQVWIVIPWLHRLGQTLFDLRRLAHVAKTRAVDLRIVSRRHRTRVLAREAGIPVHAISPIRLWGLTRGRTPLNPKAARRVARTHTNLGWYWRRRPRSLGLGAFLMSLLIVVLLLGVMAASAVAFVPSATVEIRPVARGVATPFDVEARTGYRAIDYGKAIVPARMVQVIIDGVGDTPATGRIDVAEGHASGDVVLANRTTEPVIVPKGTIVRTSSGVTARFYTVSEIELKPVLYSHERVGVIALEPGPESNVGALTVNIVEGEIALKVDVLNDASMKGGSIKRAAIVDYRDFDRLRAEMIERLQGEAYEQLVSELDNGEFVPPGSLDVQVMAQHFYHVVDQRSDVLSMDMKVVARGLAIDGADLEALATQLLLTQAGEGMGLIEDSLRVERDDDMRVIDAVVYISCQASGMVAPTVDVDEVKMALRGKPVGAAVDWLAKHVELRAPPAIAIEPPWWEQLPWLPARTRLIITSGAE